MAIGTAKMIGYDLPENFNMPYLSRNITEFWRRWHITLSAWLRDYLYIPLGGNRRARGRTYVNLHAHDAARRPVARRELELRPLGRAARRRARRAQVLPIERRQSPPPAAARLAGDAHLRDALLDSLRAAHFGDTRHIRSRTVPGGRKGRALPAETVRVAWRSSCPRTQRPLAGERRGTGAAAAHACWPPTPGCPSIRSPAGPCASGRGRCSDRSS